MYCRNCGEELAEGQDVCTKCGVKVGKGIKYCPNCGTEVEEIADVCVKCGTDLHKGQEDKKYGKYDKVTIAVLCFFLGGIGVHNFVLGEKKKGIFKIVMAFCFGISSIFALIDFVKILIDSYEVNPNKLI